MLGHSTFLVVAAVVIGSNAQHFRDQGRWHIVTPPSQPPSLYSARAAEIGGFIYLTVPNAERNQTDLYEFDTSSSSFVNTAMLQPIPVGFLASDLEDFDGNLISIGGLSDFSSARGFVNAPSQAVAWRELSFTSTMLPRHGHTITVAGSKLVMFGGWDKDRYHEDTWSLDLTTLGDANMQWVEVVTLSHPSARNSHTVVEWAGHLYLFGGFFHDLSQGSEVQCTNIADGCTWYNDVWVFSPTTSSWTVAATTGAAPTPRSGHSASVVDGFMYIHGGQARTSSTTFATVGDTWALNLNTLAWTQLRPAGDVPIPRKYHVSQVVGNHIYVFGGEGAAAGSTVESILVFTPPVQADAWSMNPPAEVAIGGLKTAVGFNLAFTLCICILLAWVWRKQGAASAGMASSEYANI